VTGPTTTSPQQVSTAPADVEVIAGGRLTSDVPLRPADELSSLLDACSVARREFEAGKWSDAASRLQSALESTSTVGDRSLSVARAAAYVLLGRAQTFAGDGAAAKDAFSKGRALLEKEPLERLDAAALRDLGIALANTGDPEKGIDLLQRALAGGATPVMEVHQQLGWANMLANRPGAAVDAFTEALRIAPDDGVSLIGLPTSQRQAGDHEAAARNFRLAGEVIARLGAPDIALDQFEQALKLTPRDVDALAGKAEMLRLLGRTAEARQLANRLVSSEPPPPQVLLTSAAIELGAGRPETASKVLGRLLEMDPANVDALMLRASIAYDARDYAAAISDLEAATRLAPQEGLIRAQLGQTREASGDLQQAILDIDRAIELGVDLASVHATRANILTALGRPAEALESAERALAIAGAGVYEWRAKARALTRLGRGDEAIVVLQQASRDPSAPPDVFGELGDALRIAGRLDESLAAYHEATLHKTTAASGFAGKGEVLRLLGRWREAMTAIDRALKLGPPSAFARYTRGQLFFDRGRYEESLAELEKAVALEPTPWILGAKARTLRLLGRHEEALDALDGAARMQGENPGYLAERGETLRLLGRYDEALAALDRAIEQDPDLWSALGTRGQVHRESGDPARAIPELVQAIEHDASLEWVHADLGLAYWATGQYEPAIKHLAIAVKAGQPSALALAAYADALAASGKGDAAVRVATEAVHADPELAFSHAVLGQALRLVRQHDAALAAIDEALRLAPDYGWAHSLKGLLYFEFGRFREGAAHLKRALRINKDDGWTQGLLGITLSYVRGQQRRALESLEKAVSLVPQDVYFATFRADLLRRLGQTQVAHDAYEEIVRSFREGGPDAVPNDSISAVGWCLFQIGHYAEAVRLQRKVTRRDPQSISVQFDLALALLSGGEVELSELEYRRGIDRLREETSDWRRRGLVAVAVRDLDDVNLPPSAAGATETVRALLERHLSKLERKLGAAPAFPGRRAGRSAARKRSS
jgi:tetratricopeptide (TPR) repeat protein